MSDVSGLGRRARLCIALFATMVCGCETGLEVLSSNLADGGTDADAGHDPVVDAGCSCGKFELCTDSGRCRPLPERSSIAAGDKHTCRVYRRQLWCWGDNGDNQLGLGSGAPDFVRRPQRVGASADYLTVAAGAHHTCALRDPGFLVCWGDDSHGQNGNSPGGRTRDQRFWARDLVQLDCGGDNCCALRSEGELYCWGENSQGNAGVDTTDASVEEPTRVSDEGQSFVHVSVGAAHSCAIAVDGTLWCWGSNLEGRLGGDDTLGDYVSTPTQIGGHADWSWVSAGDSHTCGIRNDNMLYCWGDNALGELGIGRIGPDGEPVDKAPPMMVDTTHDWTRVEVGAEHTCAIQLRENSELFCWGLGDAGQLAQEVDDVLEYPTFVMADTQWSELALGAAHSCALDFSEPDAKMYCWGSNDRGQLGLGDSEDRFTPDNELEF